MRSPDEIAAEIESIPPGLDALDFARMARPLLAEAASALRARPGRDSWPEPRPIAEADKGMPILAWMGGSWVDANWNDDRYAKRPRPYWDDGGMRSTDIRNRQPEWFLPLPPALIKGAPHG